MSDPGTAAKELRAVQRTAKRKGTAEADLRAAIIAARDAGATLEAIGNSAGLSKQGIKYLLGRWEA